jgi:acyl-CoA thioesterase FadM
VEIDLRAEVRYTDRQLRVRVEVKRVGTSLTTRGTILTPAGVTAAEGRVVTVLGDTSARKPMAVTADEHAWLAAHCPVHRRHSGSERVAGPAAAVGDRVAPS